MYIYAPHSLPLRPCPPPPADDAARVARRSLPTASLEKICVWVSASAAPHHPRQLAWSGGAHVWWWATRRDGATPRAARRLDSSQTSPRRARRTPATATARGQDEAHTRDGRDTKEEEEEEQQAKAWAPAARIATQPQQPAQNMRHNMRHNMRQNMRHNMRQRPDPPGGWQGTGGGEATPRHSLTSMPL
jgi:hypothetical protein